MNTAVLLLADSAADADSWRTHGLDGLAGLEEYVACARLMERLAATLRPTPKGAHLSRPMQRKLVTMISCQMLEEEGRTKVIR